MRWEWYYKDGKRADGISKGWWPNGKLKHTWTWKDGKKDGLYTTWYGRVYKIEQKQTKQVEGTVKDGNEHGLWTKWYKNGQKWEEVTFKKGKQDGLWTYWNENGQKEREETAKDEKQDGLLWTSWWK